MHEFGLCEGVVDAVVRRAGDRHVSEVVVRAGVRHRLVPESLQLAFSSVAAGTVASDALVHLETVPVDVSCRVCAQVSESTDVFTRCPRCGSDDVEVSGGDELTLVSLTLSPAHAPASEGG